MRLKHLILSLLALLTACGICQAKSTLREFDSRMAFDDFAFSRAKWDDRAGAIVVDTAASEKTPGAFTRGMIESPELPVYEPFDHAIASWNAFTPRGSYLTVYMKAHVNGTWTKWYKMALWNTDGGIWQRTTYGKQDDSFGKIETEVLHLTSKADALKIRVELESTDGHTFPTLRYLAVNTNDTGITNEDMPPVKSAWGKELDIPYLCQLSVPGGWAWCSPTSTAMVLGYWSKQLHRPDLMVSIPQAARGTFDEDWGGTGNWSFNVAYAGEFPGIRAYVTRFTSVSQIEEFISKGVPVIVALDSGRLSRKDWESGHLMVIRGFTKDGDVVFNDPWAHLEKGEKLRKVFSRADTERAWLGSKGSYGTVYIIHPEGYRL